MIIRVASPPAHLVLSFVSWPRLARLGSLVPLGAYGAAIFAAFAAPSMRFGLRPGRWTKKCTCSAESLDVREVCSGPFWNIFGAPEPS